ncbi:uncharacterized protein LOC132925355 [Rhopalosiphum padi]|uniref:uncharacterized protein LOC132925355 n=1 Tax=Rhopalosiphum padi TaxID=40932 RepID=UPI00298E690D|nr:uncharacterized protein LOC132925355 [Rhopalosiphum padi]
MSNRMCCIVNCNNTYKNSKNVIFYSFPNRPHEKNLKDRWVKAVKPLDAQSQMLNDMKSISVSTQVSFDFDGTENFTFECTFTKTNCDVMTQACLPVTYNNTFQKPNTVDISCGPDTSFVNLNYFSGFHSILNETQLKDLTGTTFKIFSLLLSLIPDSSNSSVTKENRLLIFLLKIKLGITYSAISVLFNINPTTVTRIFYIILHCLANHTNHFIFWPNKRTVINTLPKAFKQNYPNCRCIIDCTEIKTEQPSTVEQRVYMFSRYKNAHTVTVLVAINPSGLICFLSKSYGGRTSDSFITNDSGFLSKLERADKGFPGIKVALEGSKSILVVPPIFHNGHFSEDEVLETYTVASVRIHIERVFAKLKTYLILNKITMDLLLYVDEVLCNICCVLTNLQNPIINDK